MNLKDHFGMSNNDFLSGITCMFFNSFYHDELTKVLHTKKMSISRIRFS
eukprot:UN24049